MRMQTRSRLSLSPPRVLAPNRPQLFSEHINAKIMMQANVQSGKRVVQPLQRRHFSSQFRSAVGFLLMEASLTITRESWLYLKLKRFGARHGGSVWLVLEPDDQLQSKPWLLTRGPRLRRIVP